MTHIPYRWRGELFCEDDIISTLMEYQPWSAWAEDGNEEDPNRVEEQLDDIAEKFSIDRNQPKKVLRAADFPVRLKRPPKPPSFCSVCLHWFS